MSITRVELEQADRDELIELVFRLSNRLEDLEQRVKKDFDTGSRDRAKIRAKLQELENGRPDFVEELEGEILNTENRLHRELAKLTRRVSNVEEELGFESQDIIALAEGGGDALRKSDLALLVEEGPRAVADNSSETLYRAEILASNWIRWGKSKRGREGDVIERTLASRRDDLLTRLEDAREEQLDWKQLYRAMKKIAELGPENVFLKDDSSWGKTLVQDCRDGGTDQ